METVIIILIVTTAVAYCIRRFVKSCRQEGGCQGCSACNCDGPEAGSDCSKQPNITEHKKSIIITESQSNEKQTRTP